MTSTVADMADMVERFNREVIGLPIPREPEQLSAKRKEWAVTALNEELIEFKHASTIDDEADALIDLTYFALGRLVEMGIAPRPVFEEVHRANMRKQRGNLSKRPGSLGFDAVKPDGWVAPDLAPLLTMTLADCERVFEDRAAKLAAATPPFVFKSGELLVKDFKAPEKYRPRILVMGYARHGKDTVCEMLREEFGLRFSSSSMFLAEHVVWPAMQEQNAQWFAGKHSADAGPPFPKYFSAAACFEDRANHRAFWYDAITDFNREDPARLAKAIFEEHDVYAGIRNKREFHGVKNAGLFDFSIWVDRSDHLPPEDRSSCTVEPWMADFVLDNNGSLEETRRGLQEIMETSHEFSLKIRALEDQMTPRAA